MSAPLRLTRPLPAWERRALRAFDLSLALTVLTLAAPALLALELAARRSPFRCRVELPRGAWRYAFGARSWVPSWLCALPLWFAVAAGRWSAVGGGSWREGRPVSPPLLPGVVSLAEVRGLNGLARTSRAALDREQAARWGVKSYLGLLLRSLPLLILGEGPSAQQGRVDVQGLPLENASLKSLLALILRAARSRQRWWACFVNADCVNLARGDRDYRACLRRCDALLPDGIGVRLAARLSGQRMAENLVGTDVFPELSELSAQRGLRIYLLGSKPGVAAEAVRRMEREHPGACFVGARDGYFQRGGAEEDAVVAEINAARPDVLLVGFGAPLQERWLERVGPRLEAPVLLGVGGLFDYYAGVVPRAPLWVRELGLEWAFRLAQEPARLWRRYVLGNPRFLLATARDLLTRRPLAQPEVA